MRQFCSGSLPQGAVLWICTERLTADEMEAVQLALAADLLGHARKVLDRPASPHTEVRYVAVRLAECLSDALRVAESRGGRLGVTTAEGGEDAESDETCDSGAGEHS